MKHMLSGSASEIVAAFGRLVKHWSERAMAVTDAAGLEALESSVRQQGQTLLCLAMQDLTQTALDARQEEARVCPNCQQRRRHQGVRPRTLSCSLGRIAVHGIYWACPHCGESGHTLERMAYGNLTAGLERMLVTAGTAAASFDKAEVLVRVLSGLECDDETIRRLCLTRGRELARERELARDEMPQEPQTPEDTQAEGAQGKDAHGVAGPDFIVGSCDGTMINIRQRGWSELKVMRFDRGGTTQARAYLEKAAEFLPRLPHAAGVMVGQTERACPRVFVSDCAEWITLGVQTHLPGWQHVADRFHIRQHLHATAETLYGKHSPKAGRWSASMARRLTEQGGAKLADRLRHLALFYTNLEHQRAVLDRAAFLDRHARRLNYPEMLARGLPVDSGGIESLCKQLGTRLKSGGKRWNTGNVTPMAMLTCRWVTGQLSSPPQVRTSPQLL